MDKYAGNRMLTSDRSWTYNHDGDCGLFARGRGLTFTCKSVQSA